jgi:hypothetical protein
MTIAIVPLTAFLFTDATFHFNGTSPVEIITIFNETMVLQISDFKLPMGYAAAFRIYGGGGNPPPWTDGEYAFPKASLQGSDGSQTTDGNMIFEITAHSAYLDCLTIPRNEFQWSRVYVKDGYINASVYQVSAVDRGCYITDNFRIQPKTKFPDGFPTQDNNNRIIQPWVTEICPPQKLDTVGCPSPADFSCKK